MPDNSKHKEEYIKLQSGNVQHIMNTKIILFLLTLLIEYILTRSFYNTDGDINDTGCLIKNGDKR